MMLHGIKWPTPLLPPAQHIHIYMLPRTSPMARRGGTTMKHKIHTATAAALACGASRWTRSRSRRIAGEIQSVPAGTVLHRFTYTRTYRNNKAIADNYLSLYRGWLSVGGPRKGVHFGCTFSACVDRGGTAGEPGAGHRLSREHATDISCAHSRSSCSSRALSP